MKPRITQDTLFELCPRIATHLVALGEIPSSVSISQSLRHLVKLRVSQLNHCGYCQHMHAHEARKDGEQQSRLDVLAAWQEVGCFDEKERAALAWAETLTLIANQPISEKSFNTALAYFGEKELIELTTCILEINSWNRIAVGFRLQPEC
ncbi:Mll1641 protein [Pseudoalteromonas luteoviolacea B = ATCC 29581]|nr:Mll1641 protein [Pseudoalteromonas luteoviolacea B = ATCC 29581]